MDNCVRTFNIDAVIYTANGFIVANCNAINFYNRGATVCQVFGVNLMQGQSLSIEGNDKEIDVTRYNFFFADQTDCQLLVLRKNFLEIKDFSKI